MASLINLTDRKKRILEFIIKEYIETAEPVGSRTISKNKDLGVSAATIRNEMSDLEELGLLLQPHTSAGRIPSKEAYEIYVQNILSNSDDQEFNQILDTLGFAEDITQINSIIDKSLSILTKMTNYTAVALSQKDLTEIIIKNVSLVKINPKHVVIVTVLDNGEVKNCISTLQNEVSDENIQIISNILNDNLAGRDISGVNINLLEYIQEKLDQYSMVFDDIKGQIGQAFDEGDGLEITLDGATNFLNYPEFQDITRAKGMMEFLSSKDAVKNALQKDGIKKNDINIIIGNEDMGDVIKDCSIITANFRYKGNVVGKIGIIAPKRMDYDKAYSAISYIQAHINALMNDS